MKQIKEADIVRSNYNLFVEFSSEDAVDINEGVSVNIIHTLDRIIHYKEIKRLLKCRSDFGQKKADRKYIGVRLAKEKCRRN